MSFAEGMYAGMALGDRIKDNLGRRKREDDANATAAEKENLAFAAMSPEQRRTYLEGQTAAEGTSQFDLRQKRLRMVDAQIDADREAKTTEIANNLRLDKEMKAMKAEGAANDLRERFSKMTPQQQSAYHAQEIAPTGIGVLLPESRTPEMRGFVSRGQVAKEGLQRDAEATQQERLDRVVGQFVQGRRGTVAAEPTATVQYGPDGTVQRQWVRGAAPVSASAAPAVQNTQPAATQAGGGVPEIGSQEDFDRLPVGAPFVFRGQRGVKKQ